MKTIEEMEANIMEIQKLLDLTRKANDLVDKFNAAIDNVLDMEPPPLTETYLIDGRVFRGSYIPGLHDREGPCDNTKR